MSESLAVERQGPVGRVTMNRPERHNAFDDTVIAELTETLRTIEADDGIRVVVLACDRKSVRLGIEAPSSVSILRSEIVTAIAEENQRAVETAEANQWLSSLNTPPTPPKE